MKGWCHIDLRDRRKNERGDEYLDELKNSINLSVHSRPRDIRRALSWRYASCDRRDMLILCSVFITRGVDVFYFHEVLRPVNTFDRKLRKFFLTAGRIATGIR